MTARTLRTETFAVDGNAHAFLVHRTQPWLVYAREDTTTPGYSAYYLVSTRTGDPEALHDFDDPVTFESSVERRALASPSGSRVVYVVEGPEGFAPWLYDSATGTLRSQSLASLDNTGFRSDVHWLDDQHLLISAEDHRAHGVWDTEQEAIVPITFDTLEPHATAYPIAMSQGRIVLLTGDEHRAVLRSELLVASP